MSIGEELAGVACHVRLCLTHRYGCAVLTATSYAERTQQFNASQVILNSSNDSTIMETASKMSNIGLRIYTAVSECLMIVGI